MATHFERAKGYYDSGLWSKAQLDKAVAKGWITVEEYEVITGIAPEAIVLTPALEGRVASIEETINVLIGGTV